MCQRIATISLLFFTLCLSGQNSGSFENSKRGDIRIVFYNTENYFDIYNDSLTYDDEFTPDGEKGWTYNRFRTKTMNLYKTFVAIGETEPPEIICLAEIENNYVLSELIGQTPLVKFDYEIVHYDSPDSRGIDVGLLYRRDAIRLSASHPIPVYFNDDTLKHTRDILYSKLVLPSGDTLHIFVNHWPSRLGGIKKSEFLRLQVAKVLRKAVDSVLLTDSCASIICLGDFNDEPFNTSITEGLKAMTPTESYICNGLYNLSGNLLEQCHCGTYRYRNTWNMFDQVIVSGSLLSESKSTGTCENCLHIADYDFLLVEEEKYGGKKPFRTYLGPVYKGGFSDHLPVYLDIYSR